jgi:uncharacterized protein (TIGR00156 family)
MNRKDRIAIVLAMTSVVCASAAQAQYAGPTSQVTHGTVAAVLKNPVDDQAVVLRGVLTKQVGNEKYIFSDGTGEIRVDIDTKRFAGQKVDEKTKVELHGEVEKDFLESPEIDVDTVTIIK